MKKCLITASQWETIFHDPMTTAAAVDRLVHHCVVLELNRPSYRLESAQRCQAALQEGSDMESSAD